MKHSFASLVVMAALTIGGCSEEATTPVDNGNNTSKGSLSGTITDVMGRPVVGAIVTTSPATQSVATGADGSFSIANIATGSYFVYVIRHRFENDTADVRVTAGVTTDVDFGLRESGLVAAYAFNATAADRSGQGHNGTLRGPTATTDRFGAANSAFLFDGDDWIEVPHHPTLNFGGSFSIGAWVKLARTQNDYTGVVVKGPAGTEHPGYMLLIMNYNSVGTATGQPGYVVLRGTRDLNDFAWHYLTLVADAQRKLVTVYVDGVADRSAINPNLGFEFDTTLPLRIGVERNMERYFSGAIDDVRLFNRALEPSEITELVTR